MKNVILFGETQTQTIYYDRTALEQLKFTHNEYEVQRPTLLCTCLHV